MLYQYSIDDIIPFFTIGALLLAAIYHTNLFYFNRTKLLGAYSLYLWVALLYMAQACMAPDGKIYKTPTLPYVLSAATFWLSLLLYLHFVLTAFENEQFKSTFIYRLISKTWMLTPIHMLARFPSFFSFLGIERYLHITGSILNIYLIVVFFFC